MNNKVSKLEEEVENTNSYSRRNCLEFHGIPQKLTENTNELIMRATNLVGIQITLNDISIPIVCRLKEDQLHPLLLNSQIDVQKILFIKIKEN